MTNPGSRSALRSGFALPRLLKWIGIAVLVVLLIAGMLSWWLLRTESGLHFVLARAVGATQGNLSIGQSSGNLVGPVTLDNVRYRDAAGGIDVTAQRTTIAFSVLELVSARLHVRQLQMHGVDVTLTSVAPTADKSTGEFSLAAPLDIVLDHLSLTGARVARDGQRLLGIDALDVTGRWSSEGIALTSLALRSPDGTMQLHGTISALPGFPGNGAIEADWKIGDVRYAGTLSAHGNGKQAQFDVALREPTTATLAATLTQSHALPWTATLTVPRFDPAKILRDSTLTSLALDIGGSGDKDHGVLSGDVAVNDHHVQLEPLRYTLVDQVLKIDALTLRSPEARGTFNATGQVQLDAKPVSATLALEWAGVELPADLVGQALATHGKIDASGSAEKFHAQGALSIGPPGKLADVALNLDGTPDAIVLQQLALKQANGGLDAKGTVKLKPAIGWQLTAKANRFDPGAFAAAWPGAINFDLATDGTLTDNGPDATIKLDRLGGTLRKRPVSGSANLRIKPDYVIDGTLALASGKSHVEVAGRGGEQTDATIKLAIASLSDWLPNAGGRLDGQFSVRGKWPKLAVSGSAHGAQLAAAGARMDSVDLTANLADLQSPQGTLKLDATRLGVGAFEFDTLKLDAGGTRAAHRLELDATGTPLAFKLALSGGANSAGGWKGSLNTLDLLIKDAPRLALEHPSQLTWNRKLFSASDICLAGNGPRLCVAGKGGDDGTLDARYRMEQWPLELITKIAAPDAPFQVEGILAGNGHVQRAANGAFNGSASITSAKGAISYPDSPDQPLLAYTGLALEATLSPQSTHATLRAALDHGGGLAGDVTLSGAPGSAQALSGRVDLNLNSLAFIELLTPEVANAKGQVVASYTLGGTTAAPQLNGALTLSEFAAEIPVAGLKLHDGLIRVRATDSDTFVLEGTLKSGDGTLMLAGTGGVGTNAPLKASIKGTNFLAADVPAAKVVISPDITLERSADNIRVGGSVTIPKASVDLAKLPGGGGASTSPDVVITDAERPEEGKLLPVIVAVTVKLGNDVKLAGEGLDGSVNGQLQIDQRPGRLATGTGTLNVTGTYQAYGQDLQIESGHLLFAGTALDNPGLDIRAVRKILGTSRGQFDDTITAGLQVRGTALVPVLTVFSKPTMEQSEALSYLLTGKPLSGLSSGEGDMLGSAARALGSATGDLLAKGIGARTGLDAGVSDSTVLGGAAFTVGKYLSPKLYLSYGVGLFEPGEVITLRYLINKRFNFEAENSSAGNRAGVNYRWEH